MRGGNPVGLPPHAQESSLTPSGADYRTLSRAVKGVGGGIRLTLGRI